MSRLSTQLAITAVCFLLGILLVSQFRAQEKLAEELRAQNSQNQLTLLGSLIESNTKLRDEVSKLQTQLASIISTDSPPIGSMQDELEQLRAINGTVEMIGPGVRVTLDAPLETYWIHDLVNELRNAGAEGVAVNDQRLRATSVLVGAAQSATLDGHDVSRPYIIEAVGDPDALFMALSRPGSLILQLRAQHGPSAILVTRQPVLTLMPTTADTSFRHARPIP